MWGTSVAHSAATLRRVFALGSWIGRAVSLVTMGLFVSWPVHQDVRSGGPDEGREVLPGQGAGQGL